VTAQLIDTLSGASVWSGRWDRPISDIFAVQSELSEQIAGSIGSINSSAAITAEEVRKLKRKDPGHRRAAANPSAGR
jgi:hypothetical protein